MRLEKKIKIEETEYTIKELRIKDIISFIDYLKMETGILEQFKKIVCLLIPELKSDEIVNFTFNDIVEIIDTYKDFIRTYEKTLEFFGVKDQLYSMLNKKKQQLISSFVEIVQ